MAAPIKLGSAAGAALIFQTGSRVTTGTNGIQSCAVQALCPDGANVFGFLPAAGASFNSVFGNSYLPSDFKVDITGGGFDISYGPGKSATVTINFKRPDTSQPPGPGGQRSRKVSCDTSISFKNLAQQQIITCGGVMGIGSEADDRYANYGFPEPVATVTYNIDTQPDISSIGALFALPGSSRAAGFPAVGPITTPFTMPAFAGSTVGYIDVNGGVVIDGPLERDYDYIMSIIFTSNVLGWKLTRLKSTPHADESFFDVEECWQNFYEATNGYVNNRVPR